MLKLRMLAIILTMLSAPLLALPFVLHSRMPRDPVEPEKISFGAAGLLGLIFLAGCGVSLLALVTGIIGWAKRDRVTLVIALPVPCLVVLGIGILWLEGM